MTFGKESLHCYAYVKIHKRLKLIKTYEKYGLTIDQWLISIAFGAGGLFWSILLKFIPENKCWKVNLGIYFFKNF